MIIGLCGLAGSGKDTAADSLVLQHGFVKLAFADVMKRIAKEVFAFTDEQLWGPSENRNAPDERYLRGSTTITEGAEPKFLTPRHVLQQLGTEFGRSCYQNVWVDYALRKAKELDGVEGKHYDARKGIFPCARPEIEGVAISDVRFWNELWAIQQNGGKVIRIKRKSAGLKDDAGALHKSETELQGIADACFDAVIVNEGSLQELHEAVGKALTSFRQTSF